MHANRSLYVKSPWQFEMRDNPVGEPGPGQLLVEIKASAVCGTDVAIADRLANDWQSFGHEVAGRVRAVGPGVERFRPFDLVAVDSSAPCGRCPICLPQPFGRGRSDLCRTVASYGGSATRGFGELLLTPHECAVPVPDGLPYETACLVEPLGVSLDLVRTAEVGTADDVLVIGGGPLGLGAVALSRMLGAKQVLLAELSHCAARLKAAEAFGVDGLILTDRTPLREYDFGDRKPTKTLVTAPPPMLPEAIAISSFGGVVAFIGIAFGPASTISFDADQFHFNKLQLRASHASPGTHAAEAIRLLALHPEWGDVLVSHKVPMNRVGETMLQMRESKSSFVKIVGVNES